MPETTETTLRDRIAEALWPLTDWDGDYLNAERAADAVLAVLPAPVDQAAVMGEAAEPENPAAYALAQHIADHPVSTLQAAFRYLNAPLELELRETPVAPVDRAAVLREAYEIAYAEGMRLNALEAEIGVGAYRGALAVAHLLRKAISQAHHTADEASR
ncbi:hypothetical protein [Streptomyces sp. NBC_00566]|uniref:hypothetical protein n=1 Tax=Streptomyces sp. NBC_00566 TaxID=2975778 RepID=UPI002E803C3D|nr:hypothetical protein [Streptomyces sp. NBC_00566]WUB88233.1 hypothetical protein OG812_17290 [Streptomyces sp. NBC_00566]